MTRERVCLYYRHIVLDEACGEISLIFRLDGPRKSKVTKWARNSLSTLVLFDRIMFQEREDSILQSQELSH